MLFQAQRGRVHSKNNEPPHDIIFLGDMGEKIADRKVICVRVHWRMIAVFLASRFYDPQHQLLETWAADAAENGPDILLTIIGRHGLDQSNEFINRAAEQPV